MAPARRPDGRHRGQTDGQLAMSKLSTLPPLLDIFLATLFLAGVKIRFVTPCLFAGAAAWTDMSFTIGFDQCLVRMWTRRGPLPIPLPLLTPIPHYPRGPIFTSPTRVILRFCYTSKALCPSISGAAHTTSLCKCGFPAHIPTRLLSATLCRHEICS